MQHLEYLYIAYILDHHLIVNGLKDACLSVYSNLDGELSDLVLPTVFPTEPYPYNVAFRFQISIRLFKSVWRVLRFGGCFPTEPYLLTFPYNLAFRFQFPTNAIETWHFGSWLCTFSSYQICSIKTPYLVWLPYSPTSRFRYLEGFITNFEVNQLQLLISVRPTFSRKKVSLWI